MRLRCGTDCIFVRREDLGNCPRQLSMIAIVQDLRVHGPSLHNGGLAAAALLPIREGDQRGTGAAVARHSPEFKC